MARSVTRDVYFAIADGTRREILDLLLEQSIVSAGEIASRFSQLSRPAISRHLRVLRECGVVESSRLGKVLNYSLHPDPMIELREGWLKNFAVLLDEEADAEPGKAP